MSEVVVANLLFGGLAAMLLWAALGDMRTFNISNQLNGAIALLAPLAWWASGTDLWPDGALRVAVAVAVFGALAAAFYAGMMGGGDVKMAAAVLLWFPAGRAPDFLFIMSMVGGLVTLAALARHRLLRREGRPQVPYGVAIAGAGLWLVAERYLNQFT